MDKLTLAPDKDGYSWSDGSDDFLRVQYENQGAGRYGAEILNASREVRVTWTCEQDEYEYLYAANQTHIAEGGAPFKMDLIMDSAELTEHSVIIVPGSFTLRSQQEEMYVVGATLYVQPARLRLTDLWPAASPCWPAPVTP